MIVRTYVLTTDAGSAPNFDLPATTLAICKPRLRRLATAADLVLAFNGITVQSAGGNMRCHPDSVRWAGIVGETLTFSKYWEDQRFAGKKPDRSTRPDNIYQATVAGLVQVANDVHAPGHADRDLSGVNVLVFARSWYFGGSAPVLPARFGLHQRARRGEPAHDLSPASTRALLHWLDEHAIAPPLPEVPRTPACAPRRPAKLARSRCG